MLHILDYIYIGGLSPGHALGITQTKNIQIITFTSIRNREILFFQDLITLGSLTKAADSFDRWP